MMGNIFNKTSMTNYLLLLPIDNWYELTAKKCSTIKIYETNMEYHQLN